MRRRLMHLEGDVEERFFNRFKSALCDIKEISQIIQKVAGLPPPPDEDVRRQLQRQKRELDLDHLTAVVDLA